MWWIILLSILFLVCLIPFLRVKLCIAYTSTLSVKIKVLCFSYTLYPEKKKKLKPKDFSTEKLRKKQNRLKTKKTSEKTKDAHKDKGKNISDILELIKIILSDILSPFARYLKLEIAQIHVNIGTDDAAKTAVYYGLASQSIAYIVEFLSNVTNVSVKSKKSISVQPDFTSDYSEAFINIAFGLRVWHAVSLAIKFYLGYNKLTENKNDEKSGGMNNGQQTQ